MISPEDLETFKNNFGRNFELAAKRYKAPIKEMDKSITHFQKTKDSLLSSGRDLRLANDQAQYLAIKKLNRKNPKMASKFADLDGNV